MKIASIALKAATVTALAVWWGSAPALAGPPQPLGLSDCGVVEGTYQCTGVVPSWDGVPLEATVTLPSADAGKPLPLIADIHGFGNSRWEYLDPASEAYTGNAYGWAKRGYAVLTYTARGHWGSCGAPEARLARPGECAKGYIHLADVRYEVRDTQELIGRLVDEGTADPKRIGVTGDSYGGGQSLMLAALRSRTMLPDGTLVPWRSPKGTPLALAAAAPVIPWSDLVGTIAPNGRNLSYAIAPSGAEHSPVGVFKTSFANAIAAAAQFATGPGQPLGEPFVPGRPMGYLAPPGTDPEADVLAWVARADQGEPYDDPGAKAIVEKLVRFHSAFNIDPSVAPPPLFVGSGFTDDLFPVGETLRFAERMRRQHPSTPLSLLLGDFGHQRAANKPADRTLLLESIRAWMDHYVKGSGTKPRAGVVATTQTCPRTAPSEGPFAAPTFAALARGEVRLAGGDAQTVTSTGWDPQVAAAVDPVTGGGDACAATGTGRAAGTAVYSLPVEQGFTLLGAPTVIARLGVAGQHSQLAARLWDVAPDGSRQTLVARGTYRPGADERVVFQLNANGYRFERGHTAKLELLGADAPYTRVSNGAFSVAVSDLELRLPVREAPGGQVQKPLAPVMPAGYVAVRGERAAAKQRAAKRRALKRKRAQRKRATRRARPRFTG